METGRAIEFLRTLRTVRRFTDQPVPQAVLDDLLTVARWSGSARTEGTVPFGKRPLRREARARCRSGPALRGFDSGQAPAG